MKIDQRGVSRTSRRRFLRSTAGGIAAMSLAGPGLAAAGADEFGILDRAAPELEVDYWLDRNGAPTRYSIGASRGKWIFLECFQNWCPGCHSHGFPTLKKVADASGGKFYRARDLETLEAVYEEIDQLEKTEIEIEQFTSFEEISKGWILAGIAFLALEQLLSLSRVGRLP